MLQLLYVRICVILFSFDSCHYAFDVPTFSVEEFIDSRSEGTGFSDGSGEKILHLPIPTRTKWCPWQRISEGRAASRSREARYAS